VFTVYVNTNFTSLTPKFHHLSLSNQIRNFLAIPCCYSVFYTKAKSKKGKAIPVIGCGGP
jgi:hypothetical protein